MLAMRDRALQFLVIIFSNNYTGNKFRKYTYLNPCTHSFKSIYIEKYLQVWGR